MVVALSRSPRGGGSQLACGRLFHLLHCPYSSIHHLSPNSPFPSLLHGHMATVPSNSVSTSYSNFASIFNAALEKYKHKTKQDLAKHPLLPRLQSCDSPEAILTVLEGKTAGFNQSQNSDDELTKWVTPTVNVLYSFSSNLGGVVGLVSIRTFPHDIV